MEASVEQSERSVDALWDDCDSDEALRVAVEAQIDALPQYQRSMRAYATALTDAAAPGASTAS